MSAMTLSPPTKRSHPDDPLPTTEGVQDGAVDTSAISDSASTALSSAQSQSDPSEVVPTGSNPVSKTTTVPHSSAPRKRRKFTAEEKEQQRLEKEAKDKAKQEKKDKAEEEKRAKDEAASIKRGQLEEKRRIREIEQAKKEQEKAHKEEEKAKKDRSQMRLNAFFTRPKSIQDSPNSSNTTNQYASELERRKSVSLEPDHSTHGSVPPSPSARAARIVPNKFTFLPFQVNKDVTMAPDRLSHMSHENIHTTRQRLDTIVCGDSAPVEVSTLAAELKQQTKSHRVIGRQATAIKVLVDLMSGSADHPIDLTSDPAAPSAQEVSEWLKLVPTKYLHFHEDVRPPYCGTFTKSMTQPECRKLARNFTRPELPDTNYDYDSEAEWEEPEEGEETFSELGDKDKEDIEDDDEEDLDGFLDDEEDVDIKRRMISGDLEPVSSGLVWEDRHGVSTHEDGSKATDFSDFKMEFLLLPFPQSIDPFSSAYWAPESISAPSSSLSALGLTSMNPPRLPLSVRSDGVNTMNIPNVVYKNPKLATILGTVPKPPEAKKRTVPDELLLEFKTAVDGSDLTKLGLIEHLKKQFPKIPKDAITNTLTTVAQRVGKTAQEKKWVLK